VYKYYDGRWSIHSKSELLDEVSQFYFLDENNIWAVGQNGKIFRYSNKGWFSEKTPTNENLFGILMLSEKEGFICGDNGTLLKYSSKKLPPPKNPITFSPIHLFNASKTVDDEYGVSINDFDDDGNLDILTACIFEPERLYINYGLNFRDEAQERKINSSASTKDNSSTLLNLGVAAGDIDNDGDLDIFITSLNGKNKLFVNNGTGFFKDFSKQAGVEGADSERTSSAIFADFDNDGNLDLLVINENSSNRLYINNGAGYFREVTREVGLIRSYGSVSATVGDVDGDNDLDIYICNWSSKNLLYRNNLEKGKLKFVEIGEQSGVAGLNYTKSNGAAFSDFDNDGDIDLFVTNRKHSNRLYINNGGGFFDDFTNSKIGFDSLKSYGVVTGDFDHDGFTDIYINNIGPNKLYLNHQGKYFEEASGIFGVNIEGYSTGSGAADIDNDGDLDIYVANYIGVTSRLLRNNLNNNNFIKLSFNCSASNKFGFGTKVWLYKKEKDGSKTLVGYKENNTFAGYASQGPPQIHFGVDTNYSYELEVFFPSSKIKKEILNITAGNSLIIYEEEGVRFYLGSIWRVITKLSVDRRFHVELIKIAMVVFLFFLWNMFVFKSEATKISRAAHLIIISLNYFVLTIILYDENFVFAHLLPLVTSAILFAGSYFYIERKKAVNEKQILRQKISRDLHDDLASNLSAVSLFAGSLKGTQKNYSKQTEIINKLERIITEAQQSLTEIVWSVTPQNDRLDNLIEKIRSYSKNLLSTANINVKMEIESKLENREITHEFRRNIFLIFKEALANIIKHSQAKNVIISFHDGGSQFIMTIKDDGVGLSNKEFRLSVNTDNNDLRKKESGGNGLKNIISRAEELNAKLEIESFPDKGVIISIKCKMI
jgi:signal transduction histidine kinase